MQAKPLHCSDCGEVEVDTHAALLERYIDVTQVNVECGQPPSLVKFIKEVCMYTPVNTTRINARQLHMVELEYNELKKLVHARNILAVTSMRYNRNHLTVK